MLRFAMIVVALFALSAEAQAQRLVNSDDTDTILNIARGYGSADMDRSDRRGDPAISGRLENLKYSILFSGCSGGRNCKYIQMIASFELPKGFQEKDMNDWNKTRLFGKAFINDSRDAVISLNFSIVGGVSRANFEDHMNQFKVFLREFNDFLYGKKSRSRR